jgi:anti-sigma-K factor RskA
MIPTDPAERDALAGEYVLGTLDARAAAEVVRAMETDAALRQAVAAWEARLAPLTALAPPEAPRRWMGRGRRPSSRSRASGRPGHSARASSRRASPPCCWCVRYRNSA